MRRLDPDELAYRRERAIEVVERLSEFFLSRRVCWWSGAFAAIAERVRDEEYDEAFRMYSALPRAGMGGLDDLVIAPINKTPNEDPRMDHARFWTLEWMVTMVFGNFRSYVQGRGTKRVGIDISAEAVEAKAKKQVQKWDNNR